MSTARVVTHRGQTYEGHLNILRPLQRYLTIVVEGEERRFDFDDLSSATLLGERTSIADHSTDVDILHRAKV